MFRARSGMILCAWLLCFMIMGCEEMPVTTGTVQSDPQPIQKPTATPSPNSIELNVGENVRTGDCQGLLVTFKSERPSILMIRSYVDPTQETLPSAMLQAQVSADDPASLVGQTLKSEIYLMHAQSGGNGETTWHTPPGELADIKITSIDNQRITGEIVSGQMINVTTGIRQPVTGRFTGPLQ